METGRDGAFGRALRRHREVAGLSQEALAARAGLSTAAISALERGERRRPYPRTIRALADALGVEIAALVDAPPPAVPSPAPLLAARLPAPPTPLIGRESDLTALAALWSAGARLVTLTGPGGVGKTRLAVAAAAAAAVSFPGGARFIPLASLADPSLLLSAIATALGIYGGRDLALTAALRADRPLLVLDNCEHLLPGVAPAIAALLANCPDLAIIATSRAPLRLRGEREWAVAPLTLPTAPHDPNAAEIATSPAARLFLARAAAVAPTFTLTDTNAAAVAAICQRLDGLPLAIELAAAWIRILTPAVLLARLNDALPLLVGGARDLPARQRTLRDTVAWSYDLLAGEDRAFFRHLALFVGGWTIDAATAIGPLDAAGVEQSGDFATLGRLSELLDKSLIARVRVELGSEAEPRFTMLETIRAYGLEQLAAGGEEPAARDRHAAYHLALTSTAARGLTGPEQATWLNLLGREHDNLRAALGHLLASGDAATAARFSWNLLWFWYIRGHLAEGRRWAARLLSESGELGPTDRARVLTMGATLAFQQGDFDEAIAASSAAIGLVGAGGDRAIPAQALLARSMAALGHGAWSAAATDAAASAALFRARGDGWGEGLALLGAVHPAALAGDLPGARRILAEAERILRSVGAPWGLAYALNMRAMIAQLAGDIAATVAPLRESLALSRGIGDAISLYYSLTGMAGAEALLGNGERAARLFGAADTMRERTGIVMQNAANQALYAEHLAALRARLAPERFASAWETGRAMPLVDAIAEAIAGE